MPNYRRCHVPGGLFFFTVVTGQRAPLFRRHEARVVLRRAIRTCQQRWPFAIEAITLLPDHLHCIWRLPPNDSDYALRWAYIKRSFTHEWLRLGDTRQHAGVARGPDRRRGVWQRRYWEHWIRDEPDWSGHVNYIHYNAVKHGLVPCPHAWPFSSCHRYVRLGWLPRDWCCCCQGIPADDPVRIAAQFGE